MNKKILFICLIALIIPLISGCWKSGGKSSEEIAWQDEVLLVSECGMDGLPCCGEGDPCLYGQICCTDPNNMKRNYCSDNCACGALDRFCCAGEPKCDDGLACSGGYCALCGGKEQPCCERDIVCHSGLVCYRNKCLECGLVGNPCCGDGLVCLNQNRIDNIRAECQQGVCVLCGANGQRPCFIDPKCNVSHFLNNNICLACGGFNQPCCRKGAGVDYDCDQEKGLVCERGFCSR